MQNTTTATAEIHTNTKKQPTQNKKRYKVQNKIYKKSSTNKQQYYK